VSGLTDDALKELDDNAGLVDEWNEINKLDDAAKQSKKPEWLKKIQEGIAFNKQRAGNYPTNEVFLDKPAGIGGKGKYVKLDSYDPVKQEIVSRKYTQFSEIQESTGLNYVKELKDKYPPGTKIANVESNISGTNKALKGSIGEGIKGQMILEIPVPNKAIHPKL
jgi:hypothetical protein